MNHTPFAPVGITPTGVFVGILNVVEMKQVRGVNEMANIYDNTNVKPDFETPYLDYCRSCETKLGTSFIIFAEISGDYNRTRNYHRRCAPARLPVGWKQLLIR